MAEEPIIIFDPDDPLTQAPAPPGPVAPNLCARVNFRAYRYERNGVGYTGWISTRRTFVTPSGASGSVGAGECKRICAKLVYHRGRGTQGLAIVSEGSLCYGGFMPAGGRTRGALHGVLRGGVVIFTTGLECLAV